jgi:type VI secretion system secreted protein VgrG
MANDSNNDNQDSSNKPASTSQAEGGGAGETPAWANPDIVMSAPGGITGVTPESISLNAGQTTSIAAGQDIALVAGANASHLVKYGISLFAYGKASNPNKPNQETGIKLHAASGKLSSQSQTDKTSITADKDITVSSTHDAVMIQAKDHVLFTAGGAYIKLGANGGNDIEIHAPGMVEFKASMKSWAGAKSDSNSLELAKGTIKNCPSSLSQAASAQAGATSL